MGTGWDLNKLLGSHSAEEFVRANFPDVTFQEVYGKSVCFIPNHYKTVDCPHFFAAFRKLFQTELNEKVVELRPVRGAGETVEQSARDVLEQIFDFDFDLGLYGESRLIRFSALEGSSARLHAGRRYRIVAQEAEGGAGKARSSVSLASTFNAAGIVGVKAYQACKVNERGYDFDFMFALKDNFFLVPAERG